MEIPGARFLTVPFEPSYERKIALQKTHTKKHYIHELKDAGKIIL